MHVSRILRPLIACLVAAATALGLAAAPARALDIPGLVQGVDVAGHQRPGGHPIEWKTVAGPGGQSFAFIKASEGEGWKNVYYDEDAAAAKDAGLAIGAYHYARPAGDPKAQAEYFASVINAGPQLDLPPVLDLEVDEGRNPAALAVWTQTFLNEVERATGARPMIYTYRYFWYERMDNTNAFTDYPLWLAAYQNQPPRPVGGWDKVSIWQRASDGRVAGVSTPVDQNVFNGDPGAFNRFVDGDLKAGGGLLEAFQAPEQGELAVLEQNSTALVVAILGLATGILAAPQIADAARAFGFDNFDADNIAGAVRDLVTSGQLPVDDLRTMMIGDYSVGDLLILLDNAFK
ncbi:glycoside hydrolase family 25 protein [Corynebacterium auris]|uniref:glycoside hydrolase family 25 protein n=1 Tax=Corynebacterium auris TaxID=44750 RepID=UPI0025B6131C|nr:glycoside hydrolase family 25 protein [Corynebacterium auris]WJY67859.1 Lysozyme M1 precursor [Corynebacterium auris]